MKISDFVKPYYLYNFGLVMTYPIHRWVFRLKDGNLGEKDIWLGHTKEVSIIMTFVLLCVARYKRYCTTEHMVSSVLFFLRVAGILLYFFVELKMCLWYLCANIGKTGSPSGLHRVEVSRQERQPPVHEHQKRRRVRPAGLRECPQEKERHQRLFLRKYRHGLRGVLCAFRRVLQIRKNQ